MTDVEKGSDSERESIGEQSFDDYHTVTPPMHDPRRLTSTNSSAASLVATMLGGGVLSLPYAINRAGLVLGVFYLCVASTLNAVSLEILFACSRRAGAISYEEIAEFVLGKTAKTVSRVLVFLMTYGGIVGYCILIRDLSVPLAESYIMGSDIFLRNEHMKTYVGVGLVTIISPLCFFSNLKALHFASKICMLSILALVCVLVMKALEKFSLQEAPTQYNTTVLPFIADQDIKLYSRNIHDTLYSFPFMQVAFLCHFNALPVYTGLRLPTKMRIKKVIWTTVGFAWFVYAVIGISGYLYAFNHICGPNSSTTCVDGVPDNILSAFDLNDPFIDFGRLCLLATVLLSLPLLVLPSRHIFVSFFKASPVSSEGVNELEEPLLENSDGDSPEYRNYVMRKVVNRKQSLLFNLLENQDPTGSVRKRGLHICSTIFLLLSSLYLMVKLPGIGFVWNIIGSSLGFLLAFTLPCYFYINLTHTKDWKYNFAVMLLPFSVLLILACTYESILSLG